MNATLLHILQHALGLDKHGEGKQHRNHYVAGGDDITRCTELVEMGFMFKHPGTNIAGGLPWFHVTPAGIEAVSQQSPKRPKRSKPQQRYQAYHDADSNMSFGEWIKNGMYKHREATQ
jgi:hypothetical protein